MKKLILLILLISCLLNCKSQDLYDLQNSKNFASYLLRTRQYSLAAQEFERIVFMSPSDTTAKLELLKSYRLSNQYSIGLSRIEDLFPGNLFDLPKSFTNEYMKLLLLNKDFPIALNLLNTSKALTLENRKDYQLKVLLLDNKWEEASEFSINNPGINTSQWRQMKSLIREKQKLKYKSPFLAAGFSAIIPGTGKIYTGNWKDGLFSLLFVGTSAWQSYRGFKKNGVESIYGWIFGIFTIGYYGGNVYGSWKAAKNYNSNLNHDIFHQAENIIYSGF